MGYSGFPQESAVDHDDSNRVGGRGREGEEETEGEGEGEGEAEGEPMIHSR